MIRKAALPIYICESLHHCRKLNALYVMEALESKKKPSRYRHDWTSFQWVASPLRILFFIFIASINDCSSWLDMGRHLSDGRGLEKHHLPGLPPHHHALQAGPEDP